MFIVKQPVLTEKTFEGIKRRVYVFLVSPRAKKPTIKREVEFIFNVKVEKVNTLQEPWRTKRIGRNTGRLPRHKRAIVTLKEGYGITIYPQQDEPITTTELKSLEPTQEAPAEQLQPAAVEVKDE